MGRTPVKALNCSVSSESLAVPDGQPWIERRVMMICSGLTESGSGAAPTITNFPSGASPSTKAEMDLASGAVARITRAPPSFWMASAGAPDGDGPETHPAGALNPEMAQPSDALHRDHVAGPGAGIAEGIVYGDTGAEQRGGLVGGQLVRHRGHRLGGRDHVFGVAAIEADGGD